MTFEVDGKRFSTIKITVLVDMPRALYYCWALYNLAPEVEYEKAVRGYWRKFNTCEGPSVIYEHIDWSAGRMLYMLPPDEVRERIDADELPLFASIDELAGALEVE